MVNWKGKGSSRRNCRNLASSSSTEQKLCTSASHVPHPPCDTLPQATHPGGAAQTLEDLRALDMVGIYVSAHWCPPCRTFTLQLAQLYKNIAAAGQKSGVLFVSGDRDEKSFRECARALHRHQIVCVILSGRYFHEMPWVALEYNGNDELKASNWMKCFANAPCAASASHCWLLQGFLGSGFGVKSIPTLVLVDVKTGGSTFECCNDGR